MSTKKQKVAATLAETLLEQIDRMSDEEGGLELIQSLEDFIMKCGGSKNTKLRRHLSIELI